MLLETLKRETAPLHAKLDHHPLVLQLVSPKLSLDVYRHTMLKFYSFYLTHEAQLWPFIARTGLSSEGRWKLPRLQKDLEYLGIDTTRIEKGPVLVRLGSLDQALGMFYVLEGSTLGGQIISRNLKRALDLTPATGAAFFSSYAADVYLKWSESRDIITRCAEDEDEVLRSASATFIAFNDYLSNVQPLPQSSAPNEFQHHF